MEKIINAIEQSNKEEIEEIKKKNEKLLPSSIMRGTLCKLAFLFLTAIGLAIWKLYFGGKELAVILVLFVLLLSYIVILAPPIIAIWKNKRNIKDWLNNPFSSFTKNISFTYKLKKSLLIELENHSIEDLNLFLTLLISENKERLQRMKILIGSFDKVGSIPAILSFVLLAKEPTEYTYVFAFVLLPLYTFGLILQTITIKVERVKALIEFVIKKKESKIGKTR